MQLTDPALQEDPNTSEAPLQPGEISERSLLGRGNSSSSDKAPAEQQADLGADVKIIEYESDKEEATVLDQDLPEKGYKLGLFGPIVKQDSSDNSKEDPPGDQEEEEPLQDCGGQSPISKTKESQY